MVHFGIPIILPYMLFIGFFFLSSTVVLSSRCWKPGVHMVICVKWMNSHRAITIITKGMETGRSGWVYLIWFFIWMNIYITYIWIYMNICIILINHVLQITTCCKIYEVLLHIGIPEVSLYKILKNSSDNDAWNGIQHYAILDHKKNKVYPRSE